MDAMIILKALLAIYILILAVRVFVMVISDITEFFLGLTYCICILYVGVVWLVKKIFGIIDR